MRIVLKLLMALMLIGAANAEAADFGGKKFYINPGHGGHDSDDRPTPLPLGVEMFYESDGNLSRGLHLRDFLTAHGAEVRMSRVTNTSADDLNLTTIAAQANSYGGYFISLHTNGANASANYILGLYRSSADAPATETVAGSKSMVQTAVDWLDNNHLTDFTAGSKVYGDYAFYGYNLGVLRTNNCQGYLIESTFHDYRPDGLRLKSEVFNRFTAWQLARAAIDNCGGVAGATGALRGCIVGDVRDLTQGCGYDDYVSRGRDRNLAVNGAEVKLYDYDGNFVDSMTTDDCCNGVYGFFDLPEGKYTIEVSRRGYKSVRHLVEVSDNNITRQLVDLTPGENAPQLRQLWNFSETDGRTPRWLADGWSSLRNMCYAKGRLYIAAPASGKVYVIDAGNCEFISMLDMTGVEGGTFGVMDLKCVDGKIVGCNLVTKPDEPLKVYVWDTANSMPRCILSTTSRGDIARLGDTFDVEGSLDHGALLFVSSGDNTSGSYIVKYALQDGHCDGAPQLVRITDASGQPYKLGVSPRISATVSGDYWLNGQNTAPALASSDGRTICVINASALGNVTLGNDFKPFIFDNRQYGVASTYIPSSDAVGGKALTGGKIALIDAEAGWSDSHVAGMYPSHGLGNSPNDSFSTAVCVDTDGKNWLQTWLLVARQGLASFCYGEVPDLTDAVGNVVADHSYKITADIHPDYIVVNSPRPIMHLEIYDIAGTLFATSDTHRIGISLTPGLYIIKATDADGRTVPVKFVI